MKKTIALLAVMLCLAGTTSAFARGGYYGHGYSGGSHHHDGLGVAFGVVGGLLLGSALVSAATPPPPTVVYGYPYAAPPPPVVVQPPQICVEDRVVSGEWQIDPYDGRQIWVRYPYPVTRRTEVPCY